MNRNKLVLILGLIALVVVFTLQNTQVVEVQLLFWKLSMSRVLLIFLLLASGPGRPGSYSTGRGPGGSRLRAGGDHLGSDHLRHLVLLRSRIRLRTASTGGRPGHRLSVRHGPRDTDSHDGRYRTGGRSGHPVPQR